MEKGKACIFNIQKFSIHDGPGIRTVVFFKGCPLRCRWCSNPESQSPRIQFLTDKTGKKTAEGKCYSVDEVMKICRQDLSFYQESGGGVTLSGGEVTMQHVFACKLLRQLKSEGIQTAIETTGYAPADLFAGFLPLVDLFLYDMKHYERSKHIEGTRVPNDLIIKNLKQAIRNGNRVLVRIPVIPGFNNSPDDAQGFSDLLKSVGAGQVQLLPFHQFGESKYKLLGRSYDFESVPPLHAEDLKDFQKIFLKNGLDCFL